MNGTPCGRVTAGAKADQLLKDRAAPVSRRTEAQLKQRAHMPNGTKEPTYGYRPCAECGATIPLKIRRDVERKRFCSRGCVSLATARINLANGIWPPVVDEEARQRQVTNLKATLKAHHPMQGRKQSDAAKKKGSESQKRRLAADPAKILRGTAHPNWTGGKAKNGAGYVMILVKGKYRLEHRVVAEQMVGRPLTSDEHVHHKNKDRADNRPENLEVVSESEHISRHMKEYWRAKKFSC